MQFSQAALGMLVQRYRAVLKKCRVLNALGGMLLGATLLGGTALAAGPATIDTPQQVADGVEEEYTTIDVENGGTLNIARQGKVTGTTVTVKAGVRCTRRKICTSARREWAIPGPACWRQTLSSLTAAR